MTNRQAAIQVIKRLRGEGFEALLAGGCVRDMLLGRAAKDYDVATSALPGDVIKLFKRTLKIGAKFGVVMVMTNQQQVEVATFRTESGYADYRHPSEVKFSNARADAARRDFTINGMFYDPLEKRVIDYVNGQKDLQKKILRTIGNAEERFGEDFLRLLRAVRFSTELDFAIARPTWRAIRGQAANITKISAERIAMELEATLTNPNRSKGIGLLINSGLFEAILPGVETDALDFGVLTLGQLPVNIDFPLALSAVFAGSETKPAIAKCQGLKLSNAYKKHLRFLLTNRQELLNRDMGLAELKLLLAEPYFEDLYELTRAIQKAGGQTTASLIAIRKRANALKGKELKPRPLLNGHELIALGARPGPMVGLVAREMYIAQLSEELKTHSQGQKWVKRWLAKHKGLGQ